jgi:hypothetical protein
MSLKMSAAMLRVIDHPDARVGGNDVGAMTLEEMREFVRSNRKL